MEIAFQDASLASRPLALHRSGALTFLIAQPQHAIWWEALLLVRARYASEQILIEPQAEMAVSRICVIDGTGTLIGTIGLRYSQFACAGKFKEAFWANAGGAEGAIVELTQLAVSDPCRRATTVTMRMLSLALTRIKNRGRGVVVCEVHPRHVGFYKRAGFSDVAQKIELGTQPAVFMLATLGQLERGLDPTSLRPRPLAVAES